MDKVVIDADPGIDDALTIALALLEPTIDVIGLTAVGSFISRGQATRNLQATLEAFDPPKWPRIGGGDEPVREWAFDAREAAELRRKLDGPKGLGEWKSDIADLHHQRESARMLVELVRDNPNEVTLVTLGPLTNVAVAAELDNEFLGRLKGIVIVGGAFAAPGDASPVAEFNMALDPDAARVVLRSPATKTIIPTDVTRKLAISFDDWTRLLPAGVSRACDFVRNLSTFTLRSHRQHLGKEGFTLPGAAALAAIVRPGVFQRISSAVDVETEGSITRGATVFDRRDPPVWRNNIDVLRDVDPRSVVDYVATLMKQIPIA